MAEWNEWRKKNPDEDVLLSGADLSRAYLVGVLFDTGVISQFDGAVYLEGAKFQGAILTNSRFGTANLRNARLNGADLRSADVRNARLEGTIFHRAHLETATFRTAIVNGYTSFWESKVNKLTDFRGVALGSCRVDPATKQLLEYNIRRKNWEGWYQEHRILRWLVRWFWSLSDYGLRTWRIILWFSALAFAFALVYWLLPATVTVNCQVGDIRGLWHAVYFSVVTMTTLGFGDIAANPDSWLGQTLLMFQVILGYVLLGALVTRFAVLFTASGPAGKFSN